MNMPKNIVQVKESNSREIIHRICDNGPISKRELQNATNLSWSSISVKIDEFCEQGIIIPVGKRENLTVGRNSFLYDINEQNNYIVGMDINLMGACCIVTDLKGRIISKHNAKFKELNKDSVMKIILNLLDSIFNEIYRENKILAIGISGQGIINCDDKIWNFFPAVVDWIDVPICEILSERYGVICNLIHDTDSTLLAEQKFGCLTENDESVILIRMFSGIGMSILANGKIYRGFNSEAGEIAYYVVDKNAINSPNSNKCYLADFASGDGLVSRFLEEADENTKIDPEIVKNKGYSELIYGAIIGDLLCIKLFTEMGTYLGEALGNIITLLKPEKIVFHGDLTESKELFYTNMKEIIKKMVFRNTLPKFIFSKLDNMAPALGAYVNVLDDVIDNI